jgi:hypothetical protein
MNHPNNLGVRPLGRFSVPSGRLYVGDPEYVGDDRFSLTIAPVKSGPWLAEADVIESFGERVTSVVVFSECHAHVTDVVQFLRWAKVGVDTGRICISDVSWLARNAELPISFKTHSFGLMLRSGFGDGIYPVCIREADGVVVSVRIVFIESEGFAHDSE